MPADTYHRRRRRRGFILPACGRWCQMSTYTRHRADFTIFAGYASLRDMGGGVSSPRASGRGWSAADDGYAVANGVSTQSFSARLWPVGFVAFPSRRRARMGRLADARHDDARIFRLSDTRIS